MRSNVRSYIQGFEVAAGGRWGVVVMVFISVRGGESVEWEAEGFKFR